MSKPQKPSARIRYRANFLYGAEPGSAREAGYEFANGHSEAYRKAWWKILVQRIKKEPQP